MSLISDALKKARQEAARQDSLRQNLPYAMGSTSAPDRSRSYAPLLAGLAVGLLLAGGLAGLYYFVAPERGEKPEARIAETAPPSVVVEEAPAPSAEPVAPSVVPQITEPTVPETAPPAPVQAPVPEVRTPEPLPPPSVAPPEPAPAPAPQEPVAPPAPQAPAPREIRSYVGEVPVPGGGVVRLNGIAFSTESPVAVLDGKVVGPGEVVQGFTVVEIRQNQVKLEGHGETVFVSLK